MLQTDVEYRITMKLSHFLNESLLVFLRKIILFGITITWPKTVFTRKTLIFTKTIE